MRSASSTSLGGVYLYAMHRYDIIFYARLVDALAECTNDYTLLITEYLYDIETLRAFILRKFEKIIVVPVKKTRQLGFAEKIRRATNLNRWYDREINKYATLVLLDKSSVYSRFFIKRSSNVVLIQQTENIGRNYTLDLKATTSDFIRCAVLGSCFATHYRNKSSGGVIRALKFKSCGKKKDFRTFYNVFNPSKDFEFELPSVQIRGKQKIVIFGSRFLSWPFFRQSESGSAFRRLSEIYKYIYSEFNDYDFYYIPHPLESGDELSFINKIFSGSLNLVGKYFSSEHFLYENRDIRFTFSIGSTSSFSAYSMGFSAKVFYKMLGFPADVEATYDDVFSSVPSAFFAQCLPDLLVPESRKLIKPVVNQFERFLR